MGKINNIVKYPLKTAPALTDFLLGTDSESGLGVTINLSLEAIKNLIAENTLLTGTADPSIADPGTDGDMYIDTLAWEIYGPKASGAWPTPGTSIIGPNGAPGADGLTILNGTIPPTSEGVDGDFYIDTELSVIYGPKAAGSWPAGIELKGTDGADGDDGAPGADGLTILNGTIPPTSEGAAGDFYIDTVAWNIYGPKEGSWGEATSIVGAPGTPGADGLTILNGTIPPTLEGVDGDFYIDTVLSVIYGPKATTWPAGVELKGVDGSDGSDGSDGTDGLTILNGPIDPVIGEGVVGDFFIRQDALTYIFGPKTVSGWGTGVRLTGYDGSNGVDGKTILNGILDPGPTEGVDGDFYINIATSVLFGPKDPVTIWTTNVSMVGAPGAPGADGNTILNGTVDPTWQGAYGDFYFNTLTSTLFGPKDSGVWPAGVSLVGAAGSSGTDGTDGTDGAPGADGLTILNGTIPPTLEGVDGDFYIDTVAWNIYGPKEGSWGEATSIVGAPGTPGADGEDGAPGADGNTILNGTVDPTWQGAYGDFYFNTLTSTLFGPKDSGVWPAGVSLVGAAGSSGTDGTDGTDGISAYTYVAYASSDAGADFSNVFSQDLNYIAVLATDTEIETPTASDFTGLWKYYGGGSLNTPEGLFTCDLDESYALDLGSAETEVVIPLTEQIADNLALEYDHIVIDSSIDKFYRCHIDINGSMIPNQACNLLLNLYVDDVLIRSRILTIIEPAEGVFIPDLMVMDYTVQGITGGSSIHMTVEALESGVVVAPQEFNVRCTFVEYTPSAAEGGFVDEEGDTMVDEEGDIMIDETE